MHAAYRRTVSVRVLEVTCGSVQLLPRQYNCGSTSILAMRAEAERPQNEMIIVASLSRDAVQVPPTTDEVDALPAASMVALYTRRAP